MRLENHGATFLGEKPIQQNGSSNSFITCVYSTEQNSHIRKIEHIPHEHDDAPAQNIFRSKRAVTMYPPTTMCLNLLWFTSRFARCTNGVFISRWQETFSNLIRLSYENFEVLLSCVPHDLGTNHVTVFTYASFLALEDSQSKPGVNVSERCLGFILLELLRSHHGQES